MLQPDSFVVEVIRQPEPTPDVSIDFYMGMFAMAGVLLLAAAIGSLLVAGVVIFVKRRRGVGPPSPEQSARRLRI